MNDVSSVTRPIELRPYQNAALAALWSYWRSGGGNPLVEMPTGSGKTLIIAEMARRLMSSVSRRVLVVTHVRELIEQDARAIRAVWPDAPIGICCAGLNRREPEADICLATIQSLYRDPEIVGQRNLVVIDEVHLVPASGDGMYLTVLEALRGIYPPMRVAGLTATPYRLDSGRLDQGENRLFDRIVFSYGLGDAIADGWLVPLVAGATTTEIDVQGVARRGGEFVASDLEAAADLDELVSSAADEIVTHGRNRRAWLCFCAGVRHAAHVREALRDRGIAAETVTGETPGRERDEIFSAFRAGRIRALTGCNVFTTGFDVPTADLIAMLRPTLSTGLYVQMLGRGTRKCDGKTDCLVLDFAGNVPRHGFVDAVMPHEKARMAGRNGERQPAAAGNGDEKTCPKCRASNALNVRTCSSCGHVFRMPHEDRANGMPLLTRDLAWSDVDYFTLHMHEKPDSRPTLRVQYHSGPATFYEWFAFEHQGTARAIAISKWESLGGRLPAPETITEALRRQRELCADVQIALQRDGQYQRVVARRARPQVLPATASQPQLPLDYR
jgi:DNA repair protein RadD